MIDITILERSVLGATADGKHTNWGAVKLDYEQRLPATHTADYYRIYWSRHTPLLTKSLPLVNRLSRPIQVTEQDMDEILFLRTKGYNIEMWTENGILWAHNKPYLPKGGDTPARLPQGNTIRIALISDTHIGSKYHDNWALQAFYDIAYSRGVRDFYHAGDMTDGYYKNRDDSFWEQNAHGFQEQLDAVVNTYPQREGVVTYFITGNHDVTHLRNGGANIGETIAMARKDMVFLGHNYAKIWLTPQIDLALVHPTDGGAEGMSLKLQKMIDNGGRNAKILLCGHYHKACYLPNYKGVHGFVAPCFQWQTGFMRDNNLLSFLGGIILTLTVSGDQLLSVTPEFIDLGALERSKEKV